MEIVRELREIPNLSLALGLFDGVHIGHQAVIECAVDYARSVYTSAAVVTFNQNPHSYLNEITPKYILTLDDKYKYLEELGIDYVIELDFAQICNMSPNEYLEDILVKYFSPMAISTGFNHKFGNGRAGTVKFLSDNQDRYRYVFFATPPQAIWGDIISSSSIREFIKSGSTDMAATMLGRKFSVVGNVIKGRELGRTIGYPTANIIYPLDIIEPPYGVYDVDVQIENEPPRKAIANFGVSPTVSDDGIAILEVYILNFDGDLYDKQIRVFFNNMVRRDIKFDSLDDLKTQIDFDIQALN
jgi:riboflavin kinase/FMN adenylyltransferase